MKSIQNGLMAIALLLSVTVGVAQDKKQMSELAPIFENYFQLKEALVKSNGKLAASESKALLETITAVKMESLSTAEHTLWMKLSGELKEDAEHISETTDVGHQRDHFMTLSNNLHELLKVSSFGPPVYYQHCPMANKGKGASWLSQESKIKNPYYGSQMLSCGKTIETLSN